MTQEPQAAEQLVRDYADLWNTRAYAKIPEVVSKSFVHATPAAPDGEVQGPDGVEEFMREVTTAFPDFEVTIVEMVASEETVMVEHQLTMTHEGEFNGVPPTQRRVELQSMAACRVADGKLRELREYVNMQDFFDQLGVTDK